MMKCYCISGLGADERVFNYLKFPSFIEPVYLPWLSPLAEETIEDYAVRLSVSINGEAPFYMIGLSMGGMISVEIQKTKKPTKLILISSITSASQLPAIYQFGQKFNLYKLLSPGILKNASILKKWFASYKQEHRTLLINVIKAGDDRFIRWALPAILKWKNTELPERYIHIHGTKDNVLPIANTKPTHVLTGGRHFMIIEKAEEISEILAKEMINLSGEKI